MTTDFGDHSDRVTPVPIPNTEVKPVSADGTWGVIPWESRTSPDFDRGTHRPGMPAVRSSRFRQLSASRPACSVFSARSMVSHVFRLVISSTAPRRQPPSHRPVRPPGREAGRQVRGQVRLTAWWQTRWALERPARWQAGLAIRWSSRRTDGWQAGWTAASTDRSRTARAGGSRPPRTPRAPQPRTRTTAHRGTHDRTVGRRGIGTPSSGRSDGARVQAGR